QLLDTPFPDLTPDATPQPEVTDSARALGLLREVAVLALEGRLQPKGPGEPVHAPVPAHAVSLLDRLAAVGQPYQGVEQFQADLIAIRNQPTEINAGLRTGHLALLLAFLYPILLMMLGVRYIYLRETTKELYDNMVLSQNALAYLGERGPALRQRVEA